MKLVAPSTPPDNKPSVAELPELHPACAAWPQMPDADLCKLAADIAVRGLLEPITLAPDGRVLDGRNRFLACLKAGVSPTTVIYAGDPVLFSLSKNAHRRHLSDDQRALVAAKLATRTVGNPNFAIGPSGSIGVPEVAKITGLTESKIKSAKVVHQHGTEEENRAVALGHAPVRKTADDIRARKRAPALPKPQLKPKTAKTPPAADPIDDVARAIVTECADGKWRSLPKVAAAVRYAEEAARKALKSLGETGVAQRKNSDGELEYWIAGTGDADLRHLLAAKDAEIAGLKDRIAEQDREIERLMEQLTTPSLAMVH